MSNARRQPGEGLSAIFRRQEPEGVAELTTARSIAVTLIDPNPFQPRTAFDEEALDELAASLRTHGVLQAVLVRPSSAMPGRYELVLGERRWRAGQRAGLREIPAIVRPTTDTEMADLALQENVQRRDLNAVDEGWAYKRLMNREGLSLREVAEWVHRSHEHVARRLRIVADPQLEEAVRAGGLGATVAAELGREENVALRALLLERVARGEQVTMPDVVALSQAVTAQSDPETAAPPLKLSQPVTPQSDRTAVPSGSEDATTRPALAPSHLMTPTKVPPASDEIEPLPAWSDEPLTPSAARSQAVSTAALDPNLVRLRDLRIIQLHTGRAGEPRQLDTADRATVLRILEADLAWLKDSDRRTPR